jgi:phage recombination protein Bet
MNAIVKSPGKHVLTSMADRFGMEPAAFEAAVRATCMPTGPSAPQATQEEFAAFLLVANEYKLNPLTKEIYAFPRRGGGIVPIVSVDGWANLINSHGECDGFDFEYEHDAKGELVSVTCKMYRKDRSRPVVVKEFLSECIRSTEPWKMKHRMLRHKALIQAARYAFGFAGIYDEDEGDKIATMKDITPQAAAPAEPPVPPEETAAATTSSPTTTTRSTAPSQAETRQAPKAQVDSGKEAGQGSDPGRPNLDKVLAQCDYELARIKDADQLKVTWAAFWKAAAIKWGQLVKEDQTLAFNVLQKHKDRLANKPPIDRSAEDAQVVADGDKDAFSIEAFCDTINAKFGTAKGHAELIKIYENEINPMVEAGSITEEHVNGPIGTIYAQHQERIDTESPDDPPNPDDDGFPGDD